LPSILDAFEFESDWNDIINNCKARWYIILLNENYNKNESREHYELKQIAKYILYSKGYNCIATEVQFSNHSQYLKDYEWFNGKATTKNTIDVVGIKGNLLNLRDNNVDNYKVMGIEAKASYSDFLNGFCCQCEYTYIIAPVGIIPIDKLPNKIGLIEVALGNYAIKNKFNKFEFEGITTVKQCSSRKKEIYKRDDIYNVDIINILKRIAYRSTVNDIFKKNEIVIEGL